MTSDPSINAPSDEPENGVLAETGAIDTSDLGLLTTNTAHVNVILPTEEDDDDDDVVDDDDISILFDSLLSGDTVTAQQEDVAAVVIDTDDVAEQEHIEPEHLEQEPASDESASASDESTSVDIDDELDVVEAEIIDDEDEVAPVTADASDDDFADESEESETDLDDEPEGESDGEAEPADTSADDEPVDQPDEEPEPEAVDVASTTAVAEDVSDEDSEDDDLDEDDDELDEDEEAEDASAVSEDSDEIASDDESDEPSGSETSEDDAGDVAFDTEESEDGEFEDEGAEGEGSDGEESDEDESERAAAAEDEEPDADAADSEEFDRDAADEDAETSAPVAETETVDTHETVDAHETEDVTDLESDGVDADALLAEGETPAPETPAVENASAVEAPLIAAAAAAAITATQTDPAPAERKADEEPPVSETRDIHDLERVTVRTGAVETTPAPRRLGEVGEGASRETPDLLTADRLLDPHRKPKPEPEGAWQHFVYTVSGKRINLGDGKRARERKELTARIAAPIVGGSRFVPVLSRKGGVGKTTVTTLIGMALADARDDRVVAVDANPDRGTLAERISRSSTKTVRDLVRVRDEIRGYNDLSSIVSRDETRLDVLASDSDPRVAEAFSDIDYRHVADVASRYYSIVLTDTGTGIVHSVMGATLDLADQLVIVAGLSVDEARAASETLTWLETNGFSDIARGAIVVLNQTSAGAPVVRMNEVEEHFRTRVSEVVRIPYDPMIASGSAITFRDLQPETRVAARELAALVVNGLRGTSA